MSEKKTHIIIITSSIIFILFTLFISFRNGTKQIKQNIDNAFKEAINKNYNNRLLYMSYAKPESLNYDVMRYIITPAAKSQVKKVIFKSRKGNTIITPKDSLDGETGKRMINEYIFSQIYPIKVDELDSLFQVFLAKHEIIGRTGVVYYSATPPLFSHHDSIVPASAYCTPRYTLDITGNIKVQAWVDYKFITVIKHINNSTWWFAGFILLMSGLFFYYYCKKKKSINKKDSLPSPIGIEIDLEKQELHINGTACTIQKLDLTLLDLFYRNAGTCVDREIIKQIFWPTDDNANEKIDAHIKAIRKILKEYPEYQLVTVRGKGYYLVSNTNQQLN